MSRMLPVLPAAPVWPLLLVAACTDPSGLDDKPGDDTAPDDSRADSGGGDTAETGSETADTGNHTGDTAPDTTDTSDSADSADTGEPAAERWVKVSVAAAVTSEGRLVCWGEEEFGAADCPEGVFTDVGQGAIHGCALDVAGGIVCWHPDSETWDDRNYGQADAPAGTFSAVDAWYVSSCAIDASEQAVCWGANEWGGDGVPPPERAYVDVSVGGGWDLGLTTAGEIEIWGGVFGGDYEIEMLPSGGPFLAIAAGQLHGCAVDGDGLATCWGGEGVHTVRAPQDVRFLSLEAGFETTCGITTDRAIRCWESHTDKEMRRGVEGGAPDKGTWESVSVGYEAACAISTDGELTCLGPGVEEHGLVPVPEIPE